MTLHHVAKTLGLLAATSILMASAAAQAQQIPTAQPVVLSLTRVGALVNVNDAAGLWQHEGGKVFRATLQVGNYSIHRRVTLSGTSPQNTAMVTMTVFFNSPAGAPDNITLEGTHDFSSGKYIGSVSAASALYKPWIAATFAGSTATNTLTITR
jgi:hypothetical protein